MIRIKINWTFLSPSLQVASGILKAEVIKYGSVNRVLFKCKVKRDSGTLGYESLDKTDKSLGIPHDLFEVLKPTIDTMVRSYFHGMLLDSMTYEWIDESLDISIEEWAKLKGVHLPKGI